MPQNNSLLRNANTEEDAGQPNVFVAYVETVQRTLPNTDGLKI